MPEAGAAAARGPGATGAALPPELAPGALDEATTARVEQLIEEEEGAQNRFAGLLGSAVTGVALAMAFVATLYPARRAARTAPAEALRYE